jgi:hypothetical protein
MQPTNELAPVPVAQATPEPRPVLGEQTTGALRASAWRAAFRSVFTRRLIVGVFIALLLSIAVACMSWVRSWPKPFEMRSLPVNGAGVNATGQRPYKFQLTVPSRGWDLIVEFREYRSNATHPTVTSIGRLRLKSSSDNIGWIDLNHSSSASTIQLTIAGVRRAGTRAHSCNWRMDDRF